MNTKVNEIKISQMSKNLANNVITGCKNQLGKIRLLMQGTKESFDKSFFECKVKKAHQIGGFEVTVSESKTYFIKVEDINTNNYEELKYRAIERAQTEFINSIISISG